MDVTAIIQWNVRISRFLGLSQLSKPSAKQEYQVVKWRRIYPVFLICLILSVLPLHIHLTGFWNSEKFNSAVSNLYWNILSPLVIIITIRCSLLNQDKMCATLNRVIKCIKPIENITGDALIYTTTRCYLLKFLLIFLSMAIVDLQYYCKIDVLMEHLELLFIFLIICSNSIFSLVISSLLQTLRKGINQILKNDLLTTFPKEMAFKKVSNLDVKHDSKKHVSKI